MAKTVSIYGIKACDTMKKARTWLEAAGVAYCFHDYKIQGIDAGILQGWAKTAGWEKLPPLPDREGFAGSFAGVSGDALLVAGGANFPGAKPWEGGAKAWTCSLTLGQGTTPKPRAPSNSLGRGGSLRRPVRWTAHGR